MRTAIILAAGAVALPAQQREYTDPATRMAMYRKHEAMLENSAFGNVRWQFLGPKNISGRVTDLAIATPRGKTYTMYVAGASGGVWKTTNEGMTWEPVFEEGPSTSIGDVTLAPSNQEIVWVGTGEANVFRSSMAGAGVFKSVDGGRKWQHMGLVGTHTIPRIRIHPKNPDIVYVAASGHEWTDNPERGVYKTVDGGRTWKKLLYIDERTGCIDLVMHPTDPDTLWAATWQRIRRRYNDPRVEPGYDKSAIYKTTDGGETWTPVVKGLPEAKYRGRIGIDVCRKQPDTLYAFIDNYEVVTQGLGGRDSYGRERGKTIKGAEVYRSDDGGARWRKTSPTDQFMMRVSSTYGWVFGQVRADPTIPDRVYIMGIGLHVSDDSGKTWKTLRGMHGDHHALWIDPDNSDFLVNGNDGGANLSYDGGANWRLFVSQIPMVQFFNVNYDMSEPFKVYGSVQDHGSRRGIVDLRQGRRRIPAQDWEGAPGGEGSSHFIDPTNPDIVFSAGFYGSITRTDVGRGRRGEPLLPPVADGEPAPRGQWLAPFILSHHDPKTLYHGMNRLYRSTEGGDNLRPISPDLTYDDPKQLGDIQYQTIFTIAESHHRYGEVYCGTDDGRVWRTPDGGQEWIEITKGVKPHRWISRLETSRYADGTVYMAQNGKRNDDFTPYLWKTTDHGATWQSIVGNIPIGPINVVREDPKDKRVLYVGTDLGVYITMDGGATWHTMQNKLPSTFVSDLIIHPRDDIIVISTHGRGMFAMDGQAVRRQIRRLENAR